MTEPWSIDLNILLTPFSLLVSHISVRADPSLLQRYLPSQAEEQAHGERESRPKPQSETKATAQGQNLYDECYRNIITFKTRFVTILCGMEF